MNCWPLKRQGCLVALALIAGVTATTAQENNLLLGIAFGTALLFFSWHNRATMLLGGLVVMGFIVGYGYGQSAKAELFLPTQYLKNIHQVQGNVLQAPKERKWYDLQVTVIDHQPLKKSVRIRVYQREIAPPQIGQTILVKGKLQKPQKARNPGGYDEEKILYGQGIGTVMWANKSYHEIAAGSFWQQKLYRLQSRLSARLHQSLSQDAGAFLEAVLFGASEQLHPDFYHRLQQLGLVHVFAVSGLHVGILVGTILASLRALKVYRFSFQLAILMPVVILYVLLTGAQPSAVRAGIMAIFLIMLLNAKRYRDPWTVLVYAAFFLIVVNPFCIWQLGFQLSFAVTAGLIALAPVFEKILEPLPKFLRSILSVSIAAFFASAPLIAQSFHIFTPMSIFMNLIIVPLIGILIPLSFAALLVSLVNSWLAVPLFYFVESLIFSIRFLVDGPGSWLAKWHWHTGLTPWWSSLVFIAVGFWLYQCRWHKNLYHQRQQVIALLLMAFAMICLFNPADRHLALSIIDVGQGSAAAWQTESKQWIVFDTGKSPDTTASYLRSCGVQSIDAVVLSHADDDHVGGLKRLLQDFRIKELYTAPEAITAIRERCAETLSETQWIPVATKREVHVGKATIFLQHEQKGGVEDANANQIVCFLRESHQNILFPGDCNAKAFDHFSREPLTIFIAAHHGSRYGIDPGYLEETKPKLAIISAGENNSYGHPHQEVVQCFMKQKIPYLCTKDTGTIQGWRYKGDLEIRTHL